MSSIIGATGDTGYDRVQVVFGDPTQTNPRKISCGQGSGGGSSGRRKLNGVHHLRQRHNFGVRIDLTRSASLYDICQQSGLSGCGDHGQGEGLVIRQCQRQVIVVSAICRSQDAHIGVH